MTPWYHAVSSAKAFGGSPEDYIAVHNWFDCTKAHTGNFNHRALRHHSQGVEDCIREFGDTIYIPGTDMEVPVKIIAELHVMEDCGFIPTVADWLAPIKEHPAEWMLKVKKKSKSVLKVEDAEGDAEDV